MERDRLIVCLVLSDIFINEFQYCRKCSRKTQCHFVSNTSCANTKFTFWSTEFNVFKLNMHFWWTKPLFIENLEMKRGREGEFCLIVREDGKSMQEWWTHYSAYFQWVFSLFPSFNFRKTPTTFVLITVQLLILFNYHSDQSINLQRWLYDVAST